jgi:hypothetical protein
MGRRLAAKFPSFREKIDLPMRGGANFGLLEVPISNNKLSIGSRADAAVTDITAGSRGGIATDLRLQTGIEIVAINTHTVSQAGIGIG